MIMRIRISAALLLAGLTVPAFGQSTATPAIPQRVDRLEREMKAVQRKVFPGGSQQFFEAEIAPSATPGPAPGTPANSPVADLTARVDTLERELARLTGQSEEDARRIRQLEESVNRFKGDVEFRLNAVEGGAAPAAAGAPAAGAAPLRPTTPTRETAEPAAAGTGG